METKVHIRYIIMIRLKLYTNNLITFIIRNILILITYIIILLILIISHT